MHHDGPNSNLHAPKSITGVLNRRQALMTPGALGLLGCGAGDPDAATATGGSSGGSGTE